MNIARQRIHNQLITHNPFTDVQKMIGHLGALQAQDYAASKWSVGARLPGVTDAGVEAAIEEKKIVRTWVMRGTLHYLAPPDVKWIRELVAPRLIAGFASTYKKLELTENILAKSGKVMAATLKGSNRLTRTELLDVLEKNKISVKGLRTNHLLLRAALDGIICYGPRSNKDFTFVLQDEWIPSTPMITRDEALKKIAIIFFRSHAPATLKDFAGWAGITLTEARSAIEMISSLIAEKRIGEQTYLVMKDQEPVMEAPSVHLLPSFDEYLMGYKDRTAMLDPLHAGKVVGTGNGLYSPVIVVNGVVEGTWRRTIKKNEVVVEIFTFGRMRTSQNKMLHEAIDRYGKFMQLPVKLVM